MTINLGSGADTVFAMPDALTPITIKANAPSVAPGDVLWLSLAGVTSPLFAPNGLGAGTYTFGNAAAFNYTGFESAMGYIPGDYDGDGGVGEGDYDVWKANFGQTVTPGTLGDGNGDGIVDAADYTVWRNNLGATQSVVGSVGGVSVAAVQVDTSRQTSSVALAVAATLDEARVFTGANTVARKNSAGASSSRLRAAHVIGNSPRDNALVAWLSDYADATRGRTGIDHGQFTDGTGGAIRNDVDDALVEAVDVVFQLVGSDI